MKNNATHNEWIHFFSTIDATKLATAQHFLPKKEPSWYQSGLPHYKPKNCLAFMVGSLSSLLTRLKTNLPHLNTPINHQLNTELKERIPNDFNLTELTLNTMIEHLKKDIEPILKLQSLNFFELGKMAVKFSIGTLNIGLSSQSYIYLLLLSHYNTHPKHPFAFLEHKIDFLYFLNFLSNYLLRYHPNDLKNENATDVTTTIQINTHQKLQQLLALNQAATAASIKELSTVTDLSKDSGEALIRPTSHPETEQLDSCFTVPDTGIQTNKTSIKLNLNASPADTDYSIRSQLNRCKKRHANASTSNYPSSHPLYSTGLSIIILMPLMTLVRCNIMQNTTSDQSPFDSIYQYGFQLITLLIFTALSNQIIHAATDNQDEKFNLKSSRQPAPKKTPLIPNDTHPKTQPNRPQPMNVRAAAPSTTKEKRVASQPYSEPLESEAHQEEKKNSLSLNKQGLLNNVIYDTSQNDETTSRALKQWHASYYSIINSLQSYAFGFTLNKNFQEPVQKILDEIKAQPKNVSAPKILQRYKQLHQKLTAVLKPETKSGSIFRTCGELNKHIQHIHQQLQANQWPSLR